MALERYNAKRDFKVTSEPPGKLAAQKGDLRFVIQKHAASRLHYDFRLELGGVLLSWAVPRGPSLDPADRRLAVHVEDHPVDYGGFEGIIPQGEYGGGSVVVWDRGHWYPEGDDPAGDYKRGHLKFSLVGEKLRGSFALVRMHGHRRGDDDADNWLLIKHEDEYSDSDGEKLVRDRPESILSGRTVEQIADEPDKVWHSNRGGRKGGPARPSAAERDASRAARKPAPRPSSPLSDEDRARKRMGLAPRAAEKRAKPASKPAAKKTATKAAARKTTKVAAKKTATKVAAKKTATKVAAKKTATKAAAQKTATKSAAKKTTKAAARKATKVAAKKTGKRTTRKRGAATSTKKAGKKSARSARAHEEPGPLATLKVAPGRAPLPERLAPELATLVDEVPPGPEWLHEIKYDGYRLVARIDGPDIALLTRKGEDWSPRFPWLVDALHRRIKVKQAMLDGELVHLGADGVTRFGELQAALSDGHHGSLVYFVFDLLHLAGHDLRPLPLLQRKQALHALLPEQAEPGRVRPSEHISGQGAPLFTRACRLGLEGVMCKHVDAPYRSGRHRDWLKVKCGKRQEVVVGGFTPARSGSRDIGSLLLGVHDDKDALVYCGKVGSGFDFAGAARLRARLDALAVKQSPFAQRPPEASRATYVKPEIVVEIAFTDWTRDGRMRHPVFQGVREDRRPEGIRRERALPVEAAVTGEPAKPGKPGKPAQPAAPARPARRSKPAAKSGSAEVLGVAISHPDRVLYPDAGYTKRQIAEYYAEVAEWMLPWIADRPLSVVRCPDDISKPCFFQKHIHHTLPPGVRTADLGGDAPFLYIDDAEGLVGLTQTGALELHVWGSTVARPDDPNWIVIDLDPDAKVPWARVKETAQAVRARLEDLGLESFVKTTGGKGLHVVLPLTPGKQDWDQVKAFAHNLALEFARAAPDLFTANASKAGRAGKIYIDYLRNYRGSTAISPYSTRARPGAPVSVPLRWDELPALKTPNGHDITNLAARLASLREDPWRPLLKVRQSLRADVLRAVGGSRK